MKTTQNAPDAAGAILKMKNNGGAPKGNRNAVKHGRYTAEQRAIRKYARFMQRQARSLHANVNRDIRAMKIAVQAFAAEPQ